MYVVWDDRYARGLKFLRFRESGTDVEYIRADLHRAEVDAECDRLTALVGRDHQCSWKLEDGEDDIWWTGCGNTYCHDGPISEAFQFCPYCCGKIRIEE